MKNSFNILIFIILFYLPNALASYTSSTIGNCAIYSGDTINFLGLCEIFNEGGNNFAIGALDRNKPLYEEVHSISVSPISKNRAIVRALIIITFDADEENPSETQVLNTSWGEVVRDKKDSSCWGDGGLKICARKIK
jgi:hypothetical protein